jgi:hypothetical protein
LAAISTMAPMRCGAMAASSSATMAPSEKPTGIKRVGAFPAICGQRPGAGQAGHVAMQDIAFHPGEHRAEHPCIAQGAGQHQQRPVGIDARGRCHVSILPSGIDGSSRFVAGCASQIWWAKFACAGHGDGLPHLHSNASVG